MAYANSSVYWIGQDNNVYVKGPGGAVQNMGAAVYPGDVANGYAGAKGSGTATRINDPNPGNKAAASTPAPAYSNGAPAAAAAPAKVDKSNDIALQNAGLASVDQQTTAGLSSIDKAFNTLTGRYDEDAAANEKDYNGKSDTNQLNLQKNKQTALVNAASGRQGLFGTLSSLGALNGSGIELANRAVQKGANDDLSGAADSYGQNQSTLDDAIGTFRREDKDRRTEASIAADNARTNVRGDAAKTRMQFLTNISNDYADQGDKDAAARYSSEASALYPEIAKSNIPNANIAYSAAAYTPSTLSNYLSGADTSVSTTPSAPGSDIPGLIAAPSLKKKQLALV